MNNFTKALESLFGPCRILGSLHHDHESVSSPQDLPNGSNELPAISTMSCEEDFTAEQLAKAARADMLQTEVVCSWLLRHPCDKAAAVCAQKCHPSYLLDVIRSSRSLNADDVPTPRLVSHWKSFHTAVGAPTSRLVAHWESAHS